MNYCNNLLCLQIQCLPPVTLDIDPPVGHQVLLCQALTNHMGHRDTTLHIVRGIRKRYFKVEVLPLPNSSMVRSMMVSFEKTAGCVSFFIQEGIKRCFGIVCNLLSR